MTHDLGKPRVAAVYDIHGNLPALEAVLRDVEREGVDVVVVGGDVMPGPMPAQSIAALDALSAEVRFIHGNGERDIVALAQGEMPARVPEQFHDVLRWVAAELHPEALERLASWPPTTSVDIAGLGRVLFCHATPRDDNELFTRLTPEDRLRPIFEETGASVVICGHTHMQFDRTVGQVRVVNAGSVGMPFGEPGAYWALLGPDVELRCTPYDLPEAAERIRGSSYPAVASFDVEHPPSETAMLEVFESAALR